MRPNAIIIITSGGFLLAQFAQQALATPPDVTLLCDTDFPEICENMCWAIRCGNPNFPQRLTFDSPSKEKKKERRDAAGCGRPNRYNSSNQGKPGFRGGGKISCDEYPFASTKEADQGH